MKKKILILILGMFVVLAGVLMFINSIQSGRLLMMAGMLIEVYAIVTIVRSYKTSPKD
jgi:hypothetical protein